MLRIRAVFPNESACCYRGRLLVVSCVFFHFFRMKVVFIHKEEQLVKFSIGSWSMQQF